MPAAPSGFAIFPTAIGHCAIAWRGLHVIGTSLPEASVERLRGRLEERFPSLDEAEPPAPVRQVADDIRELLSGAAISFEASILDWAGVEPFARSVYAAALRIAPGETRTYGAIAAELGDAGLARAVGKALGRNPFPIVVPCHRVLGADGRHGGFSAPGGVETKVRILNIEGAGKSGSSLFDELPLAISPSAGRSGRPSRAH